MEPATTLRFATTARLLATEARRMGLAPPSYRSPPRLPGVDRTLRRRSAGATGAAAAVAVRVRGRPWPAVHADLIEGVVVANGLTGTRADRTRARLWQATAVVGDSPTVVPPARVA